MRTRSHLRHILAWVLLASLVFLTCSLLVGCSPDTDTGNDTGNGTEENGKNDEQPSHGMVLVAYRYSSVVTLERTEWAAGEPVTISVGWGDCLESAEDFRAAYGEDSFLVQWFISGGQYPAKAFNYTPYRDFESPYTDYMAWDFSRQNNRKLLALADLYHEWARSGDIRSDCFGNRQLCLKSDRYTCEEFSDAFVVPTVLDTYGAISTASFANTYTFSIPVELFNERSGALLLQSYVFDFTRGGDSGYLIPGEELILEYTRGEDGSILFPETVFLTTLLSNAEVSY